MGKGGGEAMAQSRRRKVREFTKVVVAAVMSTYFIGLAVGTYVVIIDTSQLYAYLSYIGALTGITVGFYCWKAKNENIAKHKWDHVVNQEEERYYG
jgi:O-antigen/teichoic acid export membrane protein